MNAPQFADATKASVDTAFGLMGQALNGVEQLTALNLQVIKTSLAEGAETAQAALAAKTPEDQMKLQAAVLQDAPKKAAAYARQVLAIFTSATEEQRAAAETQMADAQAKFLEAMNGVLKNAPGSDSAIALVKSAVAASNNAYDGVKKASKQVTEAVDANITKVTETAVKGTRG